MCGNGVIEISGGVKEQCDDGNIITGDGCNSNCVIEEGWDFAGANFPGSTGSQSVEINDGIFDSLFRRQLKISSPLSLIDRDSPAFK